MMVRIQPPVRQHAGTLRGLLSILWAYLMEILGGFAIVSNQHCPRA